MDYVQDQLKMSGLAFDKMFDHPNWSALVKYQRMKWELANGKKVPYANFGSGYQTEEKTKEALLTWILADNSVEQVGKYLGVWGLPRNQQIVHQNWRAFKRYSKWHAEYQGTMKSLRYAKFGTGYHSEKKTKEVLTKWAMEGTPIKEVQTTLGLTKLSGNHENYPAFMTYLRYYLELAEIRANHAANAKIARNA